MLKKNGTKIKTVLTQSGKEFVTPLSLTTLTKEKTFDDLFDKNAEAEIDHIALSRWADVIIVIPTTANFMSKLSNFMISTGSACSAGEFDYSHVLRGLGLSNESLQKSVRISFDKDKTLEDIDKFLDEIISIHQ